MQNTQHQPIWNPTRAVSLSVILTPAFGSYLQASNWMTLGQPDRAAASKRWFYASLLALVVLAFSAIVFGGASAGDKDGTVRSVLNVGALLYFCLWYFLSGRHQVRYVKETFGKTYAKKSMWKPILTALAGVVAYTAALVGLMVATQGVAAADGQTNATRPSLNLAGLLGGNKSLDCAAPGVKEFILDLYAKQLVETGIPDLISSIANHRVKFHLDMAREVERNEQSQNIDCAANVVIDFPKDDIDRSIQAQQKVLVMAASTSLTDPTFVASVTYNVAMASDPEERKLGPIVTMTTQDESAASKLLQTYVGDYQALSYATPDIAPSSANTAPWEKSYKDGMIHGCSRNSDVAICTCRIDAFEKYVGEPQMARLSYATLNMGMLAGNRFPVFAKLADALRKQCPLTESLTEIVQGHQGVGAVAPQALASLTGPAPAPAQPQQDAAQQPVRSVAPVEPVAPAPAQSAIVASFDCTKAASKIEKLTCSTPETASADRNLASAYRAAETKSADPAGLKQGQRAWLKERNVCNDSACLLKMTNDRIQALSGM